MFNEKDHNLSRMFENHGKIPYRAVIKIIKYVLDLLKSIHADGKVYGALIPINVSVYPEDNYKVELHQGVDPIQLPDDLSTLNLVDIFGLSPEHFNGNQGLDHRSDLYGLGYIAYYLLTGEANPYGANNAIDLAEKIKLSSLPDPSQVNPNVPEWLSKIVQKLTAPDQSQRYQSVFSLIRNIESGLATEPSIPEVTPIHQPIATEPEHPKTPFVVPKPGFNPYQPAGRDKPLQSAQGLIIKGLFAGLGIVVIVVAALLFFLKGRDNRQIDSELSNVLDSTFAEQYPESSSLYNKATTSQAQSGNSNNASQITHTGIKRRITIMVNELRIRKTPGTDGEIIEIVNEGDTAVTTGRITNWNETINLRGIDYYKPWIEVTSENNLTGWVFAGATDY